MNQLGLLDYRPPQPAPRASEQGKQISRVGGRVAPVLLAWCRRNVGRTFRMAELTEEVRDQVQTAPDSARRILAQLRAQGHVDVELLDRASSLYRVLSARPEAA